MADVVVDTDVFSFTLKGDTRAALYKKHLDGNLLHLSFSTVAELYRWTIVHNWGKKRIDKLEAAIGNCFVLGYDHDMAWEWAAVMSIKGRPMGPGDAWVAATALRHGLPLVTHNRKHFENIPGLAVISEA